MGRQWNTIIESLGPLTGGTMSINANLTEIEALLTTLQADVADGITVSSGTVTANGGDFVGEQSDAVAPSKIVQVGWYDEVNEEFYRTTLNSRFPVGNPELESIVKSNGDTIGAAAVVAFDNAGSVQIPSATNPLPISGTVTANPIRGATTIGTLTAGTTNGTLFATNSTRNYLLVQCTSGTAFIDTDGTATDANGIQLTSGQGITFEGSFIPTGAIAAITSTGTAQLIGRQG
jgi:hypothetical protein